MPAFPKPTFQYHYSVDEEVEALQAYRDTAEGRQIPSKSKNRLLLASWNIANLGVQERRDKDYRLIAEMISWFDLIALQEVNDDLSGLRAIVEQLETHCTPARYQTVFTDSAGNNERMAFVYDAKKVDVLELAGEVAVPPKDHRHIKLPGIKDKYKGFDRNPYVVAFRSGNFDFSLINVHLYYGKDKPADRRRRSLETYAVARWADLRRESDNAYTPNVVAVGDFNMPKAEPGDPIYTALTKRGLVVPEHTSKIGSTINDDAEYDQLAFFPGLKTSRFTGKFGTFDFDGALFEDLYDTRTPVQFRAYMRYYLSDHRILWAQFRTG